MNINQAREQFSAYHENTLEPGMRQAFERSLQADPQIEREYREFESALRILSVTLEEAIEIPYDLHDRISARIDHLVWEKAQKRKFSLFGGWRYALYGGLAVAAIFAAVVSLRPGGSSSVSTGTFLPQAQNQSQVKADFAYQNGEVHLTASVRGRGLITVKQAETGHTVEEFKMSTSKLDSPLRNEDSDPTWLTVEWGSPQDALQIVLPGKVQTSRLTGEGSLADCAKALASTYRMPVLLRGKVLESHVTWKLSEADTPDSVASSLSKTGIDATVLESGLIAISAP